jgi:hypothetical protein
VKNPQPYILVQRASIDGASSIDERKKEELAGYNRNEREAVFHTSFHKPTPRPTPPGL